MSVAAFAASAGFRAFQNFANAAYVRRGRAQAEAGGEENEQPACRVAHWQWQLSRDYSEGLPTEGRLTACWIHSTRRRLYPIHSGRPSQFSRP